MIGSMYSAVSGLAAHQTKMNVIGNNIANVNTYGFKSSRVAFTDVFYQTLNGASAPTKEKGGINASQLGYGAKVGSVDVIHTRSGSADTGRALDVYINGDGYLPVKGEDGTVKYTRVGNLKFDPAGNLTDYNGNLVLGLPINEDTGLPELGADGAVDVQRLTVIAIDPNVTYTGIAIGAGGEITGIQAGDPVFTPGPGTGWIKAVPPVNPDSQYRGPVSITTKRSDEVALVTTSDKVVSATLSANTADMSGGVSIFFDTTDNEHKLKYKDKAGLEQIVPGAYEPLTETYTFMVDSVTVSITTEADAVQMTGEEFIVGTVTAESIEITTSTYDRGGNVVSRPTEWTAAGDQTISLLPDLTITFDPARFGVIKDMTDFTIGQVGEGPGVPVNLGNIAVTNFANAEGLLQSGDGYFLQSANSGEARAVKPGAEGTGNLRSSALEMSNVDLSKEFTEMITTQRGFQANTRMITVSDEMLSELVSMKR